MIRNFNVCMLVQQDFVVIILYVSVSMYVSISDVQTHKHIPPGTEILHERRLVCGKCRKPCRLNHLRYIQHFVDSEFPLLKLVA